jgi:hypothetical protein
MLILFDVDGVLVHNRAYHLGLSRAVGYFSQRMGAGDHALTQAEIDEFEANSVTVEWEASALSAAALLLARLRAARPGNLPAPAAGLPAFWRALDALGAAPIPAPRPDFLAQARLAGSNTPAGAKPSQAALPRFLAECAAEPWAAFAAPLLHQLLDDCYGVDFSPTHQIFQNYVIGHARYVEAYHLPPHFNHPALLETEDTPLLTPGLRDRLLR